MSASLNDLRAQADYAQDEAELEQALFQPAPAPNSRLERWSLAIGYGAIGLSMAFASSMMLGMAWSGQISSFNLTDALLGWQRLALLALGAALGAFALWLFGLAYVRGKGDAAQAETSAPSEALHSSDVRRK